MKIKKILVSQPEPKSDKSPYYDLAKNNNLKIDFRPFIHVEPIPSKEFRNQKVNILEHTGVIFTSRTAIDHYFRVAKELRANIPDTMKYFCMSESIALYLQKYIVYRKRKIFFGNGRFNELLEVMSKHKKEKFLLPLSDIHKEEIPNKLTDSGYVFSKAILYRTVSSDLTDLQVKDYDILVFFSPSGISSLNNNFPEFQQDEIKIASFGPTTAKAVENAGFRLDIKAPMPQAPSMAMALDLYIKQYNKEVAKKK